MIIVQTARINDEEVDIVFHTHKIPRDVINASEIKRGKGIS